MTSSASAAAQTTVSTRYAGFGRRWRRRRRGWRGRDEYGRRSGRRRRGWRRHDPELLERRPSCGRDLLGERRVLRIDEGHQLLQLLGHRYRLTALPSLSAAPGAAEELAKLGLVGQIESAARLPEKDGEGSRHEGLARWWVEEWRMAVHRLAHRMAITVPRCEAVRRIGWAGKAKARAKEALGERREVHGEAAGGAWRAHGRRMARRAVRRGEGKETPSGRQACAECWMCVRLKAVVGAPDGGQERRKGKPPEAPDEEGHGPDGPPGCARGARQSASRSQRVRRRKLRQAHRSGRSGSSYCQGGRMNERESAHCATREGAWERRERRIDRRRGAHGADG